MFLSVFNWNRHQNFFTILVSSCQFSWIQNFKNVKRIDNGEFKPKTYTLIRCTSSSYVFSIENSIFVVIVRPFSSPNSNFSWLQMTKEMRSHAQNQFLSRIESSSICEYCTETKKKGFRAQKIDRSKVVKWVFFKNFFSLMMLQRTAK